MVNGKYALAMVGFGGMAHWHYDWITENFDNLFVYGVYDIKESQMEDARSKGLYAYSSREELMADPKVDIVLCACPNDVHKEVVIDALRAGKTAISEKPVTMNSEDLQDMIDVANETGKVFTVHQNRRWDKDFRTIKHIYDQNLLGNIFNIESRVHGSRGIPGDWRQEAAHGGGMMLDWGVHLLDQMLQMIPEKLTTIYCSYDHVTNEEVDDGFKAIFTFESGLKFHVEVGTSNFIELPRWYVLGQNGSALIENWNLDGKIVRVTQWDEKDVVPIRAAAGLTKTMAPRNDNTIHTEALPDVDVDLTEFYKNIIAATEGKEEQLIKHDELMRVMKLMEACKLSAETNKAIPFEC